MGPALEMAGDEPTLEERVAASRRAKVRRPGFLPLSAGWLARMDADRSVQRGARPVTVPLEHLRHPSPRGWPAFP